MVGKPVYGSVAQLGERSVRIREVDGSIPFRSTINILLISIDLAMIC